MPTTLRAMNEIKSPGLHMDPSHIYRSVRIRALQVWESKLFI